MNISANLKKNYQYYSSHELGFRVMRADILKMKYYGSKLDIYDVCDTVDILDEVRKLKPGEELWACQSPFKSFLAHSINEFKDKYQRRFTGPSPLAWCICIKRTEKRYFVYDITIE